MCIVGQLTLHFHQGDDKRSVQLPSKRLLLTVAPFCKKGSLPRIKGTFAYVKRRHERRPNVNHVTQKDADTLECCFLSQDEGKRRSLFYMEAKLTKVDDGNLELHFTVRVPASEKKKEDKDAAKSKDGTPTRLRLLSTTVNTLISNLQSPFSNPLDSHAHSSEVKKADSELVPLLAWLWWLFQTYDAAATVEDVRKELLMCINEEFQEVTGRLGDFDFFKRTLGNQECASPYKPKSSRVTGDSFLRHLDDVKPAKLKVPMKCV